MKTRILFLLTVLLTSGCGPVTIKKPENQKTQIDSVAEKKDDVKVTAAPDSSLFAYGNLFFGMKPAEVKSKNEVRQHLGKYDYNFRYSFNGDSALYQVIVFSDGVKVLGYDTTLKALYLNLYQILETRFGKPAKHLAFPSVFDVQNSGKYLADSWKTDSRRIDISLKMNDMNSYSVLCDITNINMAEAEKNRLKNEKNKEVNEAAGKF